MRAPVATVAPTRSLAVWECLEGSVSPGVARALGRDQGRVASRRWLSPADLPSRLWESFCASDAPLSSTGGSGGASSSTFSGGINEGALREKKKFLGRSSGPLGALLSSPALDVRLPTALQVLQGR